MKAETSAMLESMTDTYGRNLSQLDDCVGVVIIASFRDGTVHQRIVAPKLFKLALPSLLRELASDHAKEAAEMMPEMVKELVEGLERGAGKERERERPPVVKGSHSKH